MINKLKRKMAELARWICKRKTHKLSIRNNKLSKLPSRFEKMKRQQNKRKKP